LGINLIRYLLEKGHTCISYDYSDTFDYPEKDDRRVKILLGDIRNFDRLLNAMSGADMVVHAAAALPLHNREDIFSIDVDGTRNLLSAAYKHNIERVIHISTTAVYDITNHNPILENDRLNGLNSYGEAKIAAEDVCLEFRDKGLCVPIIRPKTFIGPERLGVFGLLYDWAKDGKNFPLLGNGKNRYQLLDVYDLCVAIHLCATLEKESVNDIFNIGAEKFSTMRDDYQSVLDVAGFGKKMIGFPATPMLFILRFLEFINLSPIYNWVYETAVRDSFVSIDKAKKILGFEPIYSNREALVRNFNWYLDKLDAINKRSGVSHRTPWKQGILGLAKKFF